MDMGIYQTRHNPSSLQVNLGVCPIVTGSCHPPLFDSKVGELPFTGKRVENLGVPEEGPGRPETAGSIDKVLSGERIVFSHGQSIGRNP